jgi:putative PIN family toxin of toxin-antitoxin system
MRLPRVVLDTNVLVAALRSKRGASYRLLMLLDSGAYEPVVSVPLVLEYESAAKRLVGQTRLTARDIEAIIDFICAQAIPAKIFYLWRPILRDPKDDMVLEAAVAVGCSHIVTYNIRDFVGAERFGIKVLTPRAFLAEIGGLS